MAAGSKTDFVIYHDQFYGGYSEALEQQSNVFNAASQNTIVLRPNRIKGEYEYESFFSEVANLITRRDVTSVSSASDLNLAQAEFIGVKVNRKIGPIAQTRDAFRKLGRDPGEMSFVLGQQIGKAIAVEMANTAVSCLQAGITSMQSGGMVYSGIAGTPSHTGLVNILAEMGDASQNILCWVMHSKSYFDLMKQAIADKVFEVAGVTIYSGTVATLGKPTIVLDSPALKAYYGSPQAMQYRILGLTQNACTVDESEERDIVTDVVTGTENIMNRIQGEYAYNVKLKGMKWNTGTGVNPTDAALALSTNWVDVTAAANLGKAGPGAMGLFD